MELSNIILTGAVLGDIAGSRLEFSRPKNFDAATAPLFTDKCKFTDDTVMSLATKLAITTAIPFEEAYRKLGNKYPNAGYGGMFYQWLTDSSKGPYNSFGNGSAMRVSFIGACFDNIDDVRRWAKKSAECTHNHPEGIKGAMATAEAIFLAKCGRSKENILDVMRDRYGYDTSKTLDEIRPTCRFDVTCQGSLPLALLCFKESKDYESCIRNVFSMVCDVDTISCIAGGIATAYYGTTGLNNEMKLWEYLDDYLLNIILD